MIELLKPSQILKTWGKDYKQIKGYYTDGDDGRCAVGLLLDYYLEYSIKANEYPPSLRDILGKKDIHVGDIINMNDEENKTFEQIADYLEEEGL